MPNSKYHLQLIVQKLSEKLIGCPLVKVSTSDSESLVLEFADGSNTHNLKIYLSKNLSCVSLLNNNILSRNLQLTFEELQGEVLQDIILLNSDRIVVFKFINFQMFVTLFGRGQSNVIVSNGSQKSIFPNSFDLNKALEQLKVRNFEEKIFSDLSKFPYNVPKIYLRIFESTAKLVSNNSQAKEFIDFFLKSISNSSKYYIYKVENEYYLSYLESKEHKEWYSNSDLFDTLNRFISNHFYNEKFTNEKLNLVKKYKKIIDSKLKELKHLELSNPEQRYNLYNQYATLLMQYAHIKNVKDSSIEVYDFTGQLIIIPLDNKLNYVENAEKYFKKAKSAKKEIVYNAQRFDKIQEELNEAKQMLKLIEDSNNLKDIKILTKAEDELAPTMSKVDSAKNRKFREFDLGKGYTLYVGKSSSNNDELTMNFASPHDIWLHARGVGGSHCLIKTKGKNDIVPKDIIEKAAEITAYYSKAKTGSYVPVSYTFRKFIKKGKGYSTGAVQMLKEDVVMVEPKLPNKEEYVNI